MVAVPAPGTTGVQVEDVRVSGPEGAPDITLRLHRPGRVAARAGVHSVHGGGFVLGNLETSHTRNVELARERSG
ncbi:hypothetical protein [Pseudonocardia acidicola]|uniref:Uncharacterized protein n=1 Tax=Pseudonocardia acidicola TaxID=2724939 RepID=A0ABX1S7M7_9PSEU|nr:hypothetical protein [Pseudonocardia acidicola]NMH97569.1 hypothetical protein [Pseudonocardia acidicola]